MKSKLLINQARLEWACKRGMLECDLFLAPLIKMKFAQLSDEQQEKLYELLQIPDPVLYEWFMGKSAPIGEEAHFQSLIETIRCQSRA